MTQQPIGSSRRTNVQRQPCMSGCKSLLHALAARLRSRTVQCIALGGRHARTCHSRSGGSSTQGRVRPSSFMDCTVIRVRTETLTFCRLRHKPKFGLRHSSQLGPRPTDLPTQLLSQRTLQLGLLSRKTRTVACLSLPKPRSPPPKLAQRDAIPAVSKSGILLDTTSY
jgi:hypothetical protein